MDAREAALAKAVAETVDAWLRDPRDAALYARLLLAVEAWRSAGDVTLADDGEPTGETSPAAAVLIDKVRRAQHRQHLREHPEDRPRSGEVAAEGPDVGGPGTLTADKTGL